MAKPRDDWLAPHNGGGGESGERWRRFVYPGGSLLSRSRDAGWRAALPISRVPGRRGRRGALCHPPRPPASGSGPERQPRKSLRTVAGALVAAQGSTVRKMAERAATGGRTHLRGMRERKGERAAAVPGEEGAGARAAWEPGYLRPRRPLKRRGGRQKTLLRSRLVPSCPLTTPAEATWDGDLWWDKDERGNGRPAPPTAEPRAMGATELSGTAGQGVAGNPGPRGRSRALRALGGRRAPAQPPQQTRVCRGGAGALPHPVRRDRLRRRGCPSRHQCSEFPCPGRSRSDSFPRSQALPRPKAYLWYLPVKVGWLAIPPNSHNFAKMSPSLGHLADPRLN